MGSCSMALNHRFPILAPGGNPTVCTASRGWLLMMRSAGATAAGNRLLSPAPSIYELHVGTSTPEGTFKAAESHLDYLKELGVTHVELMPIANFPGKRGWGYDGVDLYAPFMPTAARRPQAPGGCLPRKGLAVIIDVVYNHLGPTGNYLDRFGPYFTPNIRRRGVLR